MRDTIRAMAAPPVAITSSQALWQGAANASPIHGFWQLWERGLLNPTVRPVREAADREVARKAQVQRHAIIAAGYEKAVVFTQHYRRAKEIQQQQLMMAATFQEKQKRLAEQRRNAENAKALLEAKQQQQLQLQLMRQQLPPLPSQGQSAAVGTSQTVPPAVVDARRRPLPPPPAHSAAAASVLVGGTVGAGGRQKAPAPTTSAAGLHAQQQQLAQALEQAQQAHPSIPVSSLSPQQQILVQLHIRFIPQAPLPVISSRRQFDFTAIHQALIASGMLDASTASAVSVLTAAAVDPAIVMESEVLASETQGSARSSHDQEDDVDIVLQDAP